MTGEQHAPKMKDAAKQFEDIRAATTIASAECRHLCNEIEAALATLQDGELDAPHAARLEARVWALGKQLEALNCPACPQLQ